MARKTHEIVPRVLCNFRFPCLEHETNDVLEAALVHHYISSFLQLPAFCLVGVYPWQLGGIANSNGGDHLANVLPWF